MARFIVKPGPVTYANGIPLHGDFLKPGDVVEVGDLHPDVQGDVLVTSPDGEDWYVSLDCLAPYEEPEPVLTLVLVHALDPHTGRPRTRVVEPDLLHENTVAKTRGGDAEVFAQIMAERRPDRIYFLIEVL